MTKTTIALVGAALMLLAPAPSFAAGKGLTLKQLEGLLTDLGYEPSEQSDTRVLIENQGQFKNNIDFVLNADQTVLNIYSPLSDIPADKAGAVPMKALLKANDSIGPFAYAIVPVEDRERVDIEGYFDTATVTKPMLRRTIDALIAAEDAGEPLWGVDHWTAEAAAAPAAPTSYAAAQAAADALWEQEPLHADRALFITDKAPEYRAYTARADNAFKPGDKMVAYIEPQGFVFAPAGNDTFKFGVSADVEIKNAKGDVVLFQKNVVGEPLTMHEKPKDYYYNISFNLTDYPEGSYALKFSLHDLASPKTADVTLPFSVTKAATP